MNWFLTKIVYQITCGQGKHRPQFEEQWRLVCANSKANALQRAREIGSQEETSFANAAGELVSWKYLQVLEIIMLHEEMEGAELFSTIRETTDLQAYMGHLQQAHERLVQNL